MNKEERILDYLFNLERTVSALEKLEQSEETQISLFHLRSLVLEINPAGFSGIGVTSCSRQRIRETQLRILKSLSDLGTRSLTST